MLEGSNWNKNKKNRSNITSIQSIVIALRVIFMRQHSESGNSFLLLVLSLSLLYNVVLLENKAKQIRLTQPGNVVNIWIQDSRLNLETAECYHFIFFSVRHQPCIRKTNKPSVERTYQLILSTYIFINLLMILDTFVSFQQPCYC